MTISKSVLVSIAFSLIVERAGSHTARFILER